MNLLDEELENGWLNAQNTYDTWVDMFEQVFKKVKNSDFTVPGIKVKVSPQGFEQQCEETSAALNFKTPKMKKQMVKENKVMPEIKLPVFEPV